MSREHYTGMDRPGTEEAPTISKDEAKLMRSYKLKELEERVAALEDDAECHHIELDVYMKRTEHLESIANVDAKQWHDILERVAALEKKVKP